MFEYDEVGVSGVLFPFMHLAETLFSQLMLRAGLVSAVYGCLDKNIYLLACP